MKPSLLTAVDCTDRVHLIIGSNALAGARCAQSLDVGARPRVLAPELSNLHFSISKHVDEGKVDWIKRGFRDDDLSQLGREEVGGYVDAVFVALGGNDPLSLYTISLVLSE